MGCTESIPEATVYQQPHPTDQRIPMLGVAYGAGPSSTQPIRLIVREKLFSWSGDTFKIKTDLGQPFGNGVNMKGKAFALRDQMVLQDEHNKAIAVCLRKFEVFSQAFKIYTTQPIFPGQTCSEHHYNYQSLYTFARVQRIPLSPQQEVYIGDEASPSYVIKRAGSLWPKKRVVTRRGQPAALMEGGTWDTNFNSYLLTVCPGIDPCLIICLTAICDEMDEDK